MRDAGARDETVRRGESDRHQRGRRFEPGISGWKFYKLLFLIEPHLKALHFTNTVSAAKDHLRITLKQPTWGIVNKHFSKHIPPPFHFMF